MQLKLVAKSAATFGYVPDCKSEYWNGPQGHFY